MRYDDQERTHTCMACDGRGTIYYAFDCLQRKDIEVSEETFNALPDDEDDAYNTNSRYCKQWDGSGECRECDGEGIVLAEEIDYYTLVGDIDR